MLPIFSAALPFIIIKPDQFTDTQHAPSYNKPSSAGGNYPGNTK